MSGKGWGKPFSRGGTKKNKEKEHSDKHGVPKNSNAQRSSSTSKGSSGHGAKKQPSSSHDDFPAHVKPVNPITVTSIATGTTKAKVDSPSDEDLKRAFESLVGDPQGRRDSKDDVEYYKDQYRKFKSENDSLRAKFEDLSEELESAKTRARAYSLAVADTNELMNEKDRELNKLRKIQEYSIPTSEGTAGDGVSFKKLTKEKLELNKKCSELNKEKESLTKRCEEFRKSCDMLKDMLQKNPGKEMQAELLKKNTEIDKLNQQITQLQKEMEAMKSSTTEASNNQTGEVDQEFQSSVEHQPEGWSDQSDKLHQKLKELELELESTKLAMENERGQHKVEVKELESKILHQQSMNQGEVEYYREQYQRLKVENETWRDTVEFLNAVLESAQSKVNELTEELAVERSVIDNAKNEMDKLMDQLQQLHNDKRILEQQMNTGYKEREDRIAALEEFINDQVTELDKMEKEKIADKQLLEEDYQAAKAEMEQHINALQVQLEKALDPLENIEELKEVVDLEEEIGRGAYGLVKKVSLHGTICAAKDIHAILIKYAGDKEFERIKKSFLEECVKCSKLFHPNIVQFLGIHYPSKQAKLPWLVMELLDCSLTGFVEKYNDESVSLFVEASIFCDISLGIQFLHGQDIIHRDLSSNNILLTKHLTAKIADLGVAKLIDPDGSKSHTLAPGTKTFLPPEVFSMKRQYGKPVDVFALGCVMIHVITHQWPDPVDKTYYDETAGTIAALEESARRETYLNKIEKGPFKNLILNCLHDNPKQRPEIAMVVAELQKLKNSCPKITLFNIVEFESHLKSHQKTVEQLLEKERELAELKKL